MPAPVLVQSVIAAENSTPLLLTVIVTVVISPSLNVSVLRSETVSVCSLIVNVRSEIAVPGIIIGEKSPHVALPDPSTVIVSAVVRVLLKEILLASGGYHL